MKLYLSRVKDFAYLFVSRNVAKIVSLRYIESILFSFSLYIDFNAGGLERCAVQRNAKDVPLGCALFRRVDDFRKLCPLQFTGCYSGRRVFLGGMPVAASQLWEKLFTSTAVRD